MKRRRKLAKEECRALEGKEEEEKPRKMRKERMWGSYKGIKTVGDIANERRP